MKYRIIREVKDDELHHSDEFLGDDFSDELYHWKYIKKKRVNGKWRYYYDIKDALGYDEREKAANDMYTYEQAYKNRIYNQSAEAHERQNRNLKQLGKKAQASIKAFDKTPLGKLENMKDTINSGLSAISKLLLTASSKVKPSDLAFVNKYRTIGNETVYTWDKKTGEFVKKNR